VIDKEWHLDKSLSVGHILTTAILFASAISAFYSLSTRLSVVEDRIISILENQVRIDAAQDANLTQFRTDMRDMTVDLNSKLDIITGHLIQ
tara:strand:- start:523 stop:795 length:273 start_codon:yes stop_codon:yes gene_type:complete